MMKIAPSHLLLFAVTLTVKCSLCKEDFESNAANPPASRTVCGQRDKLDLNAVGAELRFEVQNALDVDSSFEYATDGNNATDWDKCVVSSLASKIDYWIDLQGIYPIDRIALLSRGSRSKGAMVFVGNFSAARTAENQQRCGGNYPETASLTEFDCDGTYWVQYVRIGLVSAALTSLQICEIEVYHNGFKYDLQKLKPHMYFELRDLHPRSSYTYATDGIPTLCTGSWSSAIRQEGSIWMTVDLKNAYTVSDIWLLTSEPSFYRIFLSNNSDFVNKTECNQGKLFEYICSATEARHIVVIYERRDKLPSALYRMHVGEIEVFTTKSSCPPPPPCGFPPYLPKATMTTDWKTATYTCDDNLIPQTQAIVCSSSGLWSSTPQRCKPTKCSNLNSPVHGSVSLPSEMIAGTIAKYSCGICYKIHGNERRQCISKHSGISLKWSGSEPSCKVVHCGDPPIVDKATHSVTSKVCGGVAAYECSEEGALMLGSRHLICSPEGKWLGTRPVCVHLAF